MIKASIEPIVLSLIEAGTEDSTVPSIVEGLRLVLDSTRFRDFYSYDTLHSPFTYKNQEIYEPCKDLIKDNPSGKRIEITDI